MKWMQPREAKLQWTKLSMHNNNIQIFGPQSKCPYKALFTLLSDPYFSVCFLYLHMLYCEAFWLEKSANYFQPMRRGEEQLKVK